MSLRVMYHLLRERLSWRGEQLREPEPDLVMDNPVQNSAFDDVGREHGLLAFMYLYHAIQITRVITAGDTVLDLACGPANQLSLVAQLNPQAHFIGVDASHNMLTRAQATIVAHQVPNVRLQWDDMTQLASIADNSVDAVMCTMSLHHLPDCTALAQTMQQIRRVLKPQGGIYLVDFGRLKHLTTQRFFAEEHSQTQSPAFILDYFNSLRAAFSVAEFTHAAQILPAPMRHYATALAPFMVVLKSPDRQTLSATTQQQIQQRYQQLSATQQADFHAISGWFKAGGLALPFVV